MGVPIPTPLPSRIAQLRALAEPNRVRLLRVLAQGELTVSEATEVLGQSQPGVSRHLKLLAQAGLAERYQEGGLAFYRATVPAALLAATTGLTDPIFAEDEARLDALRRAQSEAVARYFAENAEAWDVLRETQGGEAALESAIRRRVEVMAKAAGGRLPRLIDLGTGTGRMLALLDGLYEEAVGFDLSAEMVSVARAKLGSEGVAHARIRRGDLHALGREVRGNLVILHNVLRVLAEPSEAIGAALRTCGDGRVLVADLAPHEREDLRSEHRHRRLGFGDDEIAMMARVNGGTVEQDDTIEPDRPGGLATKLWVLANAPETTDG